MSKTVEFEVVCPDCGWVQKYFSYKKDREMKGDFSRELTKHQTKSSESGLEELKDKKS